MKKILIIIIILIVLILGYILSIPCVNFPQNGILNYIYNLKCGSPINNQEVNIPPVTNNPNQTDQANISLPVSDLKIKKIYDSQIMNYTITPNNEIIIVDNFGKIIKINQQDKQQEVIYENNNEYLPREILFSDDGSKIIFNFKNFITVFDVKTKNWRQLSESSYNITISKDNKIAYFQKENNTNSIYLLDLNKKNSTPVKLIQINVLNSKLIWKDNSNLFITSYPSSLNTGYVWLLNIKDKTLKLVYELPGLYFDWNEKINNGLLFYAGELGRGGSFSLIKENLQSQKFSFLTLPLKCSLNQHTQSENQTISTTSTAYVFCAVPINQQSLQNKLIIDDYLSYALYTEDNFYKINIQDELIEKIQIPANQFFDSINLKVADNKLFFINRFDNLLYSIDL